MKRWLVRWVPPMFVAALAGFCAGLTLALLKPNSEPVFWLISIPYAASVVWFGCYWIFIRHGDRRDDQELR